MSEAWLLERTYHARLRSGRDLSVPNLTQAMKQIINFYVPISTWQEISAAKAHAAYQDGIPVLLYGENTWRHPEGVSESWGASRNMCTLIFGDAVLPPKVVAGTDYAVRYLDARRGNSSNAAWKTWFASDSATIFDGSDLSAITFFGLCFQFPYTTHFTVIATNGHIHEYANGAEAVQGFEAFLHKRGIMAVPFTPLSSHNSVTIMKSPVQAVSTASNFSVPIWMSRDTESKER
jgi:hypothetical protein